MNRIVSFLIIVLFCTAISSCKKEENKVPEPVDNGFLINFVLRGTDPIKEFTYTSDSLVYELIEPNSYRKYIYNANRQLERIDQAFSFNPFSCAMAGGSFREGDNPRKASITQYFTFDYSNGKISKRSAVYNINNLPTLIFYQLFEYENDKVSRIGYYNPDGKLMNFEKYTINDHGNLTRTEHYMINNNNTVLLSAIEYDYDAKFNPYKVFACEGIPGINTNTNNIIKKTFISYSQGTETRSSNETLYEYNTYSYPSSSDGLSFKYINPITK